MLVLKTIELVPLFQKMVEDDVIKKVDELTAWVSSRKAICFWFKYDLGQKYLAPQVWPNRGSNSWPLDHDITFHVTETPAQTTRPSVTSMARHTPSQGTGHWIRYGGIWDLTRTARHVQKCQAKFPFDSASHYPAVMGIWWDEKLCSRWPPVPLISTL